MSNIIKASDINEDEGLVCLCGIRLFYKDKVQDKQATEIQPYTILYRCPACFKVTEVQCDLTDSQ